MTDSKRIAHIDELIRLNKGDRGRLEHIKESIENGKTLYNSDRVYIESLEKSHLLKDQSKASDASKSIIGQSEASDILSESIKIKDYLGDAKPKNKDNDTSTKINDRNTRPVSRFWAFLFAPTIFGLKWVIDFQTTRKWILISLLHAPWMMFLLFTYVFNLGLLYDTSLIDPLSIGLGLVSIAGFFANLLISRYFMYKWATLYNLKQFGCATRTEWLIDRHEARPVSRFWACVFANSMFALIWTMDFKTTRKWFVISTACEVLSYFVLLIPSIIFPRSLKSFHPLALLPSFGDFNPLILMFIGASIAIFFIPGIYFMYKWATSHNLKNFSYASRKEWLNAIHE